MTEVPKTRVLLAQHAARTRSFDSAQVTNIYSGVKGAADIDPLGLHHATYKLQDAVYATVQFCHTRAWPTFKRRKQLGHCADATRGRL